MLLKPTYLQFLNLILLIFIASIIGSCTSKETTEGTNEPVEKQENKQQTEAEIKTKAQRYIENNLKINATETYTLTHTKAYLDQDTLVDYIFLVNREAYALAKVEAEGNQKFFEYMGRTGPHNHVFVYLAGEDMFLETPPVGSAVEHPLSLTVGYLTAPSRQDFWVDYRTRNSMHRNYYTVRNKKLYLTFNCPVFDHIGEPSPTVYDIVHKESDVRIAKDIYMYHATFANYNFDEISDINSYTPDSIIGSEDLFVFFLFDDKNLVYKTPFKREKVEE
jgi:hypothetical protein